MRKKYLNNSKNRKSLLFFFIIQLMLFSQLYSKTVSVSGKITGSRYAIQNALVTFINESDTNIQYSATTSSLGYYELGAITSVGSDEGTITKDFTLGQNYPNPFSSSTAIPYELNEVSSVEVIIYDILGRVVRKFSVGQQTAGSYNIQWDGCNNFGQRVASGVYLYRISADGKSQVKKMVYNRNGNGSVTLSANYSLSKTESLSKVSSDAGNSFTVRIENTSTTTPLIVETELENIIIQNDTTINFSLTYKDVADINIDTLRQIVRGFGASNILLWRSDMTDSEIETAFGTDDGQIGFTILRLMVESDTTRWSNYISTAKKAYDMGVTIIASPWYAPDDMTEEVDGVSRVQYDMYDEYAEHLNKFVAYMADNDVPIYGISIQNEPDITDSWTSWTADEMYTFMTEYADVIEGTNVMAPESYHFDQDYSDPILNDSAGAANTDIICGHIYGGGSSEYELAEEKGKEVWMTEYLINSDGNGDNMDTSWAGALETAESFSTCMEASMSAYVWWYIVRYYGPIADGTYATKGDVTKKGYVMSQFSRFIRPGYYRVESNVYPVLSNLSVTAYKDPESSKIIIVAVNSGSSEEEQVFRLQSGTITKTFTPYTTSASKDCEQGDDFAVSDDNFTYTLEPSSITTFVSD